MEPARKDEILGELSNFLYTIVDNDSYDNVCFTYRTSNKLAGQHYKIALNQKLPEELKTFLLCHEAGHILCRHVAARTTLDYEFTERKIRAVYKRLEPLFDGQDIDQMYDIFEDYIFNMLNDWEVNTKYFTPEEIEYWDSLYPEECCAGGPVHHLLPQEVGYPPGLTANEYLLLILQNPEQWFKNMQIQQAMQNQKQHQNGTQGGCNTNQHQPQNPNQQQQNANNQNHNKQNRDRSKQSQKNNQQQNGQSGQNSQQSQQNSQNSQQNSQNSQQNNQSGQTQQRDGTDAQNQAAANEQHEQNWHDGKQEQNGGSSSEQNGKQNSQKSQNSKSSNGKQSGDEGQSGSPDGEQGDKQDANNSQSSAGGNSNEQTDENSTSGSSNDGKGDENENGQQTAGQSDKGADENSDENQSGADEKDSDGSEGEKSSGADGEDSDGSSSGSDEGTDGDDGDSEKPEQPQLTEEQLKQLVDQLVKKMVSDYQRTEEAKASEAAAKQHDMSKGYSRGGAGGNSGTALQDGVTNWSDYDGLEKQVHELLINKCTTTTKRDLLYNYNRGRFSSDVCVPRYRTQTTYDEVPMTVLMDVSGSISQSDILGFTNIFKNVAKSMSKKCTIIYWDEELRGIYDSKDPDIRPISGGGTDIGRGIKYVAENMQPGDVGNLFVVSDCCDNLEDWLNTYKGIKYCVCWTDNDTIRNNAGSLYDDFMKEFEKVLIKN